MQFSFSLKSGFVKVVKNKAYFKRFQVKFKRRRGIQLLIYTKLAQIFVKYKLTIN